ncbi:peptidoglycan editing factor PgeF [Vibrio sp. ZSDE26]|uniref:Purine nucleoside phosphorylase n=1 Tax=Vibrio amylolyticus TaxID=2847292 RepID=A0A9X1XST4_9VIBR|nr:peptidoglycan editing factor PgeF [Vibrio amylolyticus]MCK6264894.1 peptidoglycan editing factor PgeF [Vibrio amylolyticus]
MNVLTPNWNVPSCVKAVASTRVGGFSESPYEALNLGTHVGDDRACVEKNRDLFSQHCLLPTRPIWLNQTHSTYVIDVNRPMSKALDADGAFTDVENVVCSAMTADCLPVLLTNKTGTQVAAVHAGWRGLADGILENAIAKFEEASDVIAWLGPAIGKEAFEVGDDVLKAFVHFDESAKKAFKPTQEPNKWLADMTMLATQRLNRMGVVNVTASNLCTYQDKEQFFSYRRDGVTGRQAVFIWIEPS